MPIEDASLAVAKQWCGRWYDPWTGTWLGEVTFRDHVPVPAFSRDIALFATRRCKSHRLSHPYSRSQQPQ